MLDVRKNLYKQSNYFIAYRVQRLISHACLLVFCVCCMRVVDYRTDIRYFQWQVTNVRVLKRFHEDEEGAFDKIDMQFLNPKLRQQYSS